MQSSIATIYYKSDLNSYRRSFIKMKLLKVLVFLLSALFINTVYPLQRPATFCQCPCEARVAINPAWFSCVAISSLKTGGYLTADEQSAYIPNAERYTFVTNNNQFYVTGKWTVAPYNAANSTYSLMNHHVKEWLHAGSDEWARDASRRYLLTKIKGNSNMAPRDGYWQFIPDAKMGNAVYRIRNALTGEFLYVDDEQHEQRKQFKRVYLWRHAGHYQATDVRHWFRLAKC